MTALMWPPAASCVLLRAASPASQSRLTRAGRRVQFRRGETIFLHQSPADTGYVVLDGWVKLYRIAPSGAEALIGIQSREDCFGLADALRGRARSYGADAASDCTLITLPASALRAVAQHEPKFGLALLEHSFSAADQLRDQLEQIKAQTSVQRVAAFLSARARPVRGGEFLVTLPFEKHLVAAYLGIKPESLSRVLARLRAHGVVPTREGIRITDPRALEALIAQDPACSWAREA